MSTQVILKEKDSLNTQKAGHVIVFIKYCKENNIPFDPKTIAKRHLNQLLRSFYAEVRKEDGTLYKKSSLTALRFGLQRELKKIRPDLNIIDDPAFPVQGPTRASENVGIS